MNAKAFTSLSVQLNAARHSGWTRGAQVAGVLNRCRCHHSAHGQMLPSSVHSFFGVFYFWSKRYGTRHGQRYFRSPNICAAFLARGFFCPICHLMLSSWWEGTKHRDETCTSAKRSYGALLPAFSSRKLTSPLMCQSLLFVFEISYQMTVCKTARVCICAHVCVALLKHCLHLIYTVTSSFYGSRWYGSHKSRIIEEHV